MRNLVSVFLLILSFLPAAANDKYRREPFLDVISYLFTVSISDSSDMICGSAVIAIRITGKTDSIQFDLKSVSPAGKGMITDSVTFSLAPVSWEHNNGKIVIHTTGQLNAGATGTVRIVYHGIPADGLIISQNKFGERTFFSDNWPDRASNYLPCIDHPYDKAAVEFDIIAPAHYDVVGSGYLAGESHLSGGRKITRWKENVPLATKVMAFGAANFDFTLAGNPRNIPVWTYVFTQNREKGFHDYSVGPKPLDFYIGLIGPYSYEKLANVQSKTIFGGLENAGCIFYAESSVTGLGKDERLMAHEIAHQWFGNSVTENDWHHIWLSEGFATYLAAFYMGESYGMEQLEETMKSDRDKVIKYYLRSPRPVIDTTVTDLMKLLNTNSYQKGSWVLHMLRHELGDTIFWKGIRQYYQKFRNMNALTDDFEKSMEEVSGQDLRRFFTDWLFTAGQPELTITHRTLPGRKGDTEIVIRQQQDHLFNFPLELLIKSSEGDSREKVQISERITSIRAIAGKVYEIIPDPDVNLLFREIRK